MFDIFKRKNLQIYFIISLLLVILSFFSSLYNYLLFHVLIELFSIVVAFSMFIIAYSTFEFSKDEYFMFLGTAYFFIGFLDLIHTLTYRGMGIFENLGSNIPTQLWIGARYLESLSLLLALFLINKTFEYKKYFLGFFLITIGILTSIFVYPVFPDSFVENSGLTPFKVISEYIISLILIAAIYYLIKKRKHFDKTIHRLLIISVVFTILSELAFTFYIDVYGFSNFIGHIFKLLSFLLIYISLVKINLQKPYKLLFRKLNQKNETLEQKLNEIKKLEGIIPICSNCHKSRKNKGYWEKVEKYISEHSFVDFSHGLCPECREKLYPKYKNNVDDPDNSK